MRNKEEDAQKTQKKKHDDYITRYREPRGHRRKTTVPWTSTVAEEGGGEEGKRGGDEEVGGVGEEKGKVKERMGVGDGEEGGKRRKRKEGRRECVASDFCFLC